MRFIVLIFFSVLFFAACVKPISTNPVPRIEYIRADNFGTTKLGSDTVNIVIGYEDGDGNLFVDNNSQGYNFFITTYYFNSDSAKFFKDNNGVSYASTVKQPDNGYYKGKAIKGQILFPTKEFRTGRIRKIIKFEIFMRDLQQNFSNIVTSPVYTLNF